MNKLNSILNRNKHTLYGEKFGFENVKSVADFQKNVPVTTYENYIPYIEKIKNGEQNILTKEKVLLLEPSSGSTSARKLIPYTKGLKREFSSAILKWLWDLNKNFPKLKYGQFYFSITPQTDNVAEFNGNDNVAEFNGNKTAIGFDSDDEYIGGLVGKYVAKKFVVPNNVKSITDMDEFWARTIGYIKSAKNLKLVSVWNPTFLLIMLEKAKMTGRELFPHLELISCWADGNSKNYAEKLQKEFPDV
ncbi:MAG: GH3 auxin-responsive promoter family protein, partial [Ruminococcus sp.]|nr:GH3 auxin-responsive promoter family protein [Ruminococcus sp.]